MNIIRFNQFPYMLAALLAMPVLGATHPQPNCCLPGQPTAQSYKWNFEREASHLLQGMQADAARAASHAATLQALATETEVSWDAHAQRLVELKSEINDMGQKLCRLEQIRSALSPMERRMIDRVAPGVQLLADNTSDAIHFMDGHQDNMWLPVYRKYTDNLYQQASHLSHSIKTFDQYAKTRTEQRS